VRDNRVRDDRHTSIVRASVACLTLTMVVGACGSGATTAPSAATTNAPSAAAAAWPQDCAGTTLNVIAESITQTQVLESLIPDLTAKTGMTANFEMTSYEGIGQKTVLDFTTHKGTYDVISMPYELLGGYVGKNYIVPIDDYLANPKFQVPGFDAADVVPALWATASKWQDKTYGFPSETVVMMYLYRKDLMSDPGEQAAFKAKYGYDLAPATTWQQFRDNAEFFTRKAGDKLAGQTLDRDFFGDVADVRRDRATMEWRNYLWSFGGDIFDASGNLAVNSDASVKSVEYEESLMPFTPPGSNTYAFDEVVTAWQQDTVAGGIFWGDAVSMLEDPAQSKVVGKVGYASIPVLNAGDKAVAYSGPWTYVLSNDTQKKDCAYLFMAWAMSKDTQAAMSQQGGYPVIASVLQDPELVARYPYWSQLLTSLNVARGGPRIPEWPAMANIIGLAISNTLTGQDDAKAAMDAAQKDILEQFKDVFPVTAQ